MNPRFEKPAHQLTESDFRQAPVWLKRRKQSIARPATLQAVVLLVQLLRLRYSR